MAFDFSFTAAAKEDLEGILSYISKDLSNPTAASAFLDNIEKAIGQLIEFPQGSFTQNGIRNGFPIS